MKQARTMPRVSTEVANEGATHDTEGTELVYDETNFNDAIEIPAQPGARRQGTVVAVIPAYNEDRFIGSVVLKIRPYVDWIIVVDDGSKDKTARIAQEAGAEVLVHCLNRGKASALSTGFARALEMGADAVVILDGDGQHNPEEIPVVVEPVLNGQADMVIGSRFRGTKSAIPLWRRFGQHTLTLATNVASGVSSSDSQSGFRAFRADALSTLEITGEGFSIESEFQFWAREHKLRVKEAPISVVYAEKAKRNPVQQALQVLNGVLALVSQLRPLFFFGLTGSVVALLGVGYWYDIMRNYRLTGQLDLLPVMLATMLVVLGVLATFQGLTLHAMRRMLMTQTRSSLETPVKMGPDGRCGGD